MSNPLSRLVEDLDIAAEEERTLGIGRADVTSVWPLLRTAVEAFEMQGASRTTQHLRSRFAPLIWNPEMSDVPTFRARRIKVEAYIWNAVRIPEVFADRLDDAMPLQLWFDVISHADMVNVSAQLASHDKVRGGRVALDNCLRDVLESLRAGQHRLSFSCYGGEIKTLA